MSGGALERPVEAASPLSEWRQGWRVVLAAFVGTLLVGAHHITLGAMMKPIAAETGWSRAVLSAGPLLVSMGVMFGGGLLGAAVDRFGARRIALTFLGLYAVALASIGLSGGPVWTWYVAWAALALVQVGVCPIVWAMGVSSRFSSQRGMALGVAMSGLGLAGALLPLLAVAVAQAWSWHAAYFAMGALVLGLGIPVTWLCFYDSRDLARVRTAQAPAELEGMPLAQILRGSRFWRLLAAAAVVGASVGTLALHLQPIFTDAGLTSVQAAAAAAALGPAMIAGRLVSGFLLDRIPPRFVAAAAFGFPGVAALILFGFDGSFGVAAMAAAVAGFAFGAEADTIAYMTSRYFGLKAYGAVFGGLIGVYGMGYGAGPVLAGLVFSATGGYGAVLSAMVAASATAALLTLSLGRVPHVSSDEVEAGRQVESSAPRRAAASPANP